MLLNDPVLVAEIARRHDEYERALVSNDVPALTAFFWNSPHVVRYGAQASEHLYGAESIENYRLQAQTTFTDRHIVRRTVAVFGDSTASVMCEISQRVQGELRSVRQSQVWIRFPEEGWKIVAAHVSVPRETSAPAADRWSEYARHASLAVGLPLAEKEYADVALHLARAAEIATPLLACAVPDEVERAPVFHV